MEIPTYFGDLSCKIDYFDARKYKDSVTHLGQFKLLISEINFLTLYVDESKSYMLLYVGAAEGYHIIKLSEMFPNVKFILYDPQPFTIKATTLIEIHNDFFTDNDAKYYASQNNILFVSDIRNMPKNKTFGDAVDYELEENVIEDMHKQSDWVKIIKPIAACLKFRIPYEQPNFEYLTGIRYMQTYAPFSTEVRLITEKYDETFNYDCKDFDEKMAYFNCIIRNEEYDKYEKILNKYKIVNNYDNSRTFEILSSYLEKYKNNDDEKTAELFFDIVEMLYNRYGHKYDCIFE